MKLLVVAVGDRIPAWAEAAATEYVRRMPREVRIEVIPVRPERRTGQSIERIRGLEAERILDRCPPGARLIALDEHGQQASTRELADQLATWMQSGRDTALAIGGADGLGTAVLQRAETTLALSRLTLPHALARLLLVEQLYRAWTLLAGHPYHRD